MDSGIEQWRERGAMDSGIEQWRERGAMDSGTEQWRERGAMDSGRQKETVSERKRLLFVKVNEHHTVVTEWCM